jgi:hypothetical protein
MSAEATYFATPDAFRRWLERHHARASELLVGFYKRESGRPSMTWPQSVDEALCFGWIDGVRRSLGDEAYTIRFTPRKPGSKWSAINVRKVEAAGTAAGGGGEAATDEREGGALLGRAGAVVSACMRALGDERQARGDAGVAPADAHRLLRRGAGDSADEVRDDEAEAAPIAPVRFFVA